MEEIKNEEDSVPYLKVTLIGDSGVGKSCIIKRYINDEFVSGLVSTRGANYSTKVVHRNGKALRLDLWDTAGQEQYRSLGIHFYRDSYVIILVYDITNKFSFEELQKYWIEQVKESSPRNIILAIVANKSDLIEYEQVDEGTARQFAKDNDALFAVTSAKQISTVESLFLDIAKKYTGTDSALTLEEKDEIEEFRKIRKESVKITKDTQNKAPKKKGCC